MPLVAAVLGAFADNGANAGSGCASNQASFEASAEYSAEDRPARTSDSRAFAGADPAPALVVTLVVTLVIAIISMARIIILSASAALPDALVEIAVPVTITASVISLLCQTGQRSY
jgi:hypothetical protein